MNDFTAYRYDVQVLLSGWSELGRRLFAWRYSKVRQPAEYARRKRELLAGVTGDVLEIGPGPGSNLELFSKDVRWTGLEPNVFMHEPIRRQAAALGRSASILDGGADGIPLPDESMDAVVGTLVLCSVDDPDWMLSEVWRVLRPGGRFVFMEHVAAPRGTPVRRLQELLTPVSRRVNAGCRPNRETGAAIERAGFRQTSYRRFGLPLPFGLCAPQIAGEAVK